MEIVEVVRREVVVIQAPVAGAEVIVQSRVVEVVEVAKQGLPGPPGTDTFNTNLALMFEIALIP